jgi:hypothetical protein
MGKERATWEKRERHASEFVNVPGVACYNQGVGCPKTCYAAAARISMDGWMDGWDLCMMYVYIYI